MRGGQWQVLRLIRGLRDRGCESILLTSELESPLAETARSENVAVERLKRRFPPADLVHAHDARSHSWAAVCARAPLIVVTRAHADLGRLIPQLGGIGRLMGKGNVWLAKVRGL